MAKMTRERTVRERRALKQEKKDEKKQAAADARNANGADTTVPAPPVDDEETPSG